MAHRISARLAPASISALAVLSPAAWLASRFAPSMPASSHGVSRRGRCSSSPSAKALGSHTAATLPGSRASHRPTAARAK
ncbi:hypothetical protein D9M70_397900 [compost metagenome]